jgi:alpha-ribazole phosphatase
MILYFIRHGQTDWNVKGKIQGSYDSELNDTGINQAKELGQKVLDLNIKFSKIYSSKQKRALKTAEILSNVTAVEYSPEEGLEEINLGDWEGLSWKEVREKYPKEYEEWYQKRRYTKAPKGESYQDMLDRVLAAIHKIIAINTDDVAIVTHSAVIMCLQCYITDTPFHDMGKFKADNADITAIDSVEFSCNR